MVVPRVWSDKGAQFSLARTFGDRCRRGRSCAVHGGACHPSTRRVAPKTRANHGFATAIARPVFRDQARCVTALARAYMAVSVADSASSIAFSAKVIAL